MNELSMGKVNCKRKRKRSYNLKLITCLDRIFCTNSHFVRLQHRLICTLKKIDVENNTKNPVCWFTDLQYSDQVLAQANLRWLFLQLRGHLWFPKSNDQ